MQPIEFKRIDEAYKEFCFKADRFIESFKDFYKEELKENGKDIKTICKIQTDRYFA